MTTSSGATIRGARSVAAPNLGDTRASDFGIGFRHAHELAAHAKAAGVRRTGGDGWANAVICVAVMLACVVAYLVLARAFLA